MEFEVLAAPQCRAFKQQAKGGADLGRREMAELKIQIILESSVGGTA